MASLEALRRSRQGRVNFSVGVDMAHKAGVDRVVVGVDAHILVPGQAGLEAQRTGRAARAEGEYRAPVSQAAQMGDLGGGVDAEVGRDAPAVSWRVKSPTSSNCRQGRNELSK